MLERVAQNRQVVSNHTDTENYEQFTVVVGLYNAKEYLQNVFANLERQRGEFPILVVDNCSQDGTWPEVQSWLEHFPERLTLVRNPVNVGGWASVCMNLDLVKSPWFISMHQDDVYLESHVATLAKNIAEAHKDTVCIATDMGSITNSGKKNNLSRPRPWWGLPDLSNESLFITNLRLHNVPNPSSAFRVKEFLELTGPWHSTAFPDTEWLLKALLARSIELVPVVTMLYRENPNSESHTVNTRQSQMGAFLSLTRVFASVQFVEFSRNVDAKYRTDFARAVMQGIQIRVGSGVENRLAQCVAVEQMALSWDYSEPLTNEFLTNIYEQAGAERVVDLLADLGHYYELPTTNPDPSVQASASPSAPTFPGASSNRAFLAFCLVAFNLLPVGWRRALFARLRKSNLIPDSSPWFVNWRRREE